MTVGRNDPCPCGSGRKYKRCCQAADAAAEEAGSTTGVLPFRRGRHGLPREVRQAASREAMWEADAIPLMILFEEEATQRPVLILVTAGELIIHHDLRARLGGEAEDVARALDRAVTAAASAAGVLPAVLRVRHGEVAEALAPMLERRDVVVEAGPTPALEEAGRSALEEMTGFDNWPPPCRTETWGGWELPRALVARVFEAAAAFHRLAPWRVAANLQAPRAVLPSGREWTCCVLGNGGQEYGLALYSHPEDLFGLLDEDGDPDSPFEGVSGRIVSVMLESPDDAGDAAVAEARRNRWEVAGPSAWPTLVTVNTPGGGASRADVEDLVSLLRAVPGFVDGHRQALLDEDRTGRPLDRLEWSDPDTGVTFHYAGEGYRDDGADGPSFGLLPDDLREELGEIFRQVTEELGDADEDAIMDAVNARMRERMGSYNDRPQAELGGLSPRQIRRLLESDWEDPDGAVRIRSDLALEELAGAEILANARTVLGLAVDRGGLGATQKGNLKVEVVRTLVERWQSDDDLFHFVTDRGTRLIEADVDPIHRLRVVLRLAGLLRKRGPRFELTRKAREMATPEGAGELYALLFRTWFRKFNLAYGRFRAWPELQRQAAFTLYRLPRVATDWRSPGELLPELALPFALDRAPVDITYFDREAESILAIHLLDPLVGFGLLERRRKPEVGLLREEWFRVTHLLTRAIEISP